MTRVRVPPPSPPPPSLPVASPARCVEKRRCAPSDLANDDSKKVGIKVVLALAQQQHHHHLENMCGIFCCYNRQGDLAAYRPRAIACSKKQRHRGPDWSGTYTAKDSVLVHERLAIVGVGEYGVSMARGRRPSVAHRGRGAQRRRDALWAARVGGRGDALAGAYRAGAGAAPSTRRSGPAIASPSQPTSDSSTNAAASDTSS